MDQEGLAFSGDMSQSLWLHTPLMHSQRLSELLDCDVYLKLEVGLLYDSITSLNGSVTVLEFAVFPIF